ncbi:MAG: chromosomal replication initiator protein DnaA, partial [Clostridia bacterium]|nr:chromosomal replication initiator protein DnaA [Clostridia bacterium]
MENIVQIWKQVLEIIKPEFSQMMVSYNTWIETIIPLELNETTLKIRVPYEYNKEMINLRYTNLIKNALKFITDRDIELDIKVASDLTEKEVEKIKVKTNLNPLYTFDSFVIGKSNELAHATSFAIAEGRAKECNPLFLYGGVGLGKTHLMHAIGNYVLKNDITKKILYVSSEQFTIDVVNSIRTDNMQAFRDKYRTVDILMVDDIQFIGDKEATQEEFFNTFNELYQNNKIIITTADRPPKDLPTFMDRLKNRLGMGAPIDINPPDYETRIAILRKKAYQLKIEIPDEVYEFIAKRIKTNIRDLEGAIKKIMIHHMLIK